eukprot:TRINITY_DN2225_c0_g1_i1.p1 TRINITY_DN2225_c0_g1~~TRINITY_DN2225_c0_g1_i1.p1  ORF type:complete len:182 (-),score=63.08 TRINITY_DN2225_c0_g1_i1:175-720(-)
MAEFEERPLIIASDIQEFINYRDEVAQDFWGGAAVFISALLTLESNEELGWQCIIISLDNSFLQKNPSSKNQYKGWEIKKMDFSRIKERFLSKPYLARSYVKGTSPEGGYEISNELIVSLKKQPIDNEVNSIQKLFVFSTGADSPRPMKLKKNNKGLYKVSEFSSISTGCRPPVVEFEDDL